MIGYFDCYSGVSGDMVLGALVDAGVSIEDLTRELARLEIDGYLLEAEKTKTNGIVGTRVKVQLEDNDHNHGEHNHVHHRNLADIEEIISRSDLSASVKARSLAVFRRLADAEAAVHDCGADEVHFHEVGAVDTIVDIVGAVIGMEILGLKRVYASSLPTGSGTVSCEHGLLPVPAPAVVELCRQAAFPVSLTDADAELVTPTGAAIVCSLASFKKPMMSLHSVGYGYGMKSLPWPNAVRLLVGSEVEVGLGEGACAAS